MKLIITDTLGKCPPHDNIKNLVGVDHANLKKCMQLNEKRFLED